MSVTESSKEFRNDASLQLGSAIYLWLTVDSAKIPVDSTLIMKPDTIPAVDTAKVISK